MGGVGGSTSVSEHGIYQISISRQDGNVAAMTWPCLNRITKKFPFYPLQENVFHDIKYQYAKEGNNPEHLPNVPSMVGGEVDLKIGIKYLRYFPQPIIHMPSGLTVYKSHFFNSDGSCGVIGGPHEVFNNIDKSQLSSNFISNQLQIFNHQGFDVDPDMHILGYVHHVGDVNSPCDYDDEDSIIQKKFDIFNKVEEAGSEISYRCVNCRGCSTCKNHTNQHPRGNRRRGDQQLSQCGHNKLPISCNTSTDGWSN